MKTLFLGRPIMVHDIYEKKKNKKIIIVVLSCCQQLLLIIVDHWNSHDGLGLR